MSKPKVSIVRYQEPRTSVRRAVEMCGGLNDLPAGARVFVKPNIVFWTTACDFPRYGVVTTSRVVEDVVELLKERGAGPIIIGEGIVTLDPRDRATPAHAFESLGYNKLARRFGVETVNVFERPFKKVELGGGVELRMNLDALESDFIVNLPVLKTHAQAVVSLGIKNLKGLIDLDSRKKCHSPDPIRDLNYMIARLDKPLPPMLTLIDGIYTLERGPGFDGRARRSDLLIASADVLAADQVGTRVLGYGPDEVPHLTHAAQDQDRSIDPAQVEVVGEEVEAVASRHEHEFFYTPDGELPVGLAKMGIEGLSYRKYDLTMCTFCSFLNSALLPAVAQAWQAQANEEAGFKWDDVEVLTGKVMAPTPGKKKTILLGKCIYLAHRKNPQIKEMIPVKGCPPKVDDIVQAFHRAGIMIDEAALKRADLMPGFHLKKYAGKPGFDPGFYRVE